MAQSTIGIEKAVAGSSGSSTNAPNDTDADLDEWEMVEMTEKMTDDAMTVSTFEYQRRYPFQGWYGY